MGKAFRTCDQLLVPGAPEAANQQEGCDVLMKFCELITREYLEK